MATASERYRRHSVWETVGLKRQALAAARYGDKDAEALRADVVEWLLEAEKTRLTRQPALYLGVLDALQDNLNALGTAEADFYSFMFSYPQQRERFLVAI